MPRPPLFARRRQLSPRPLPPRRPWLDTAIDALLDDQHAIADPRLEDGLEEVSMQLGRATGRANGCSFVTGVINTERMRAIAHRLADAVHSPRSRYRRTASFTFSHWRRSSGESERGRQLRRPLYSAIGKFPWLFQEAGGVNRCARASGSGSSFVVQSSRCVAGSSRESGSRSSGRRVVICCPEFLSRGEGGSSPAGSLRKYAGRRCDEQPNHCGA